jgi:hypothetical protein
VGSERALLKGKGRREGVAKQSERGWVLGKGKKRWMCVLEGVG